MGEAGGELKKLFLLQEVDGQIFDVKSVLDEFPEKKTRLEESLESKKNGMSEAEGELKKLQVLKGEKEVDVESKETKVKKYQADLYGIKNNKEFQSLQQEIGGINADISVIEDELLALFDAIEVAKIRSEEEKKKFEDEKKISEQEKASMMLKENEINDELVSFFEKRDELEKTVDPAILVQYKKILGKWGRTAMAVIVDDFCGECNMQLRPQIINEVRLGKNVVICENCSRILYVEN